MNVQRAERGDVERALRQDQAVGGGDQNLRFRRGKTSERSLILERLRLEKLQAVRGGCLLYGTGRRTHAAPGRTIWLRQYQRDFVAGIDQRHQRTCRELGSACED